MEKQRQNREIYGIFIADGKIYGHYSKIWHMIIHMYVGGIIEKEHCFRLVNYVVFSISKPY
jgi:hypothetical protein